MPERIRLSRAKGWRKPEGAIVVARPTKWGNPWKEGAPGRFDLPSLQLSDCSVGCTLTRDDVVTLFQHLLTHGPDPTNHCLPSYLSAQGRRDVRKKLRAHGTRIIADLQALRGHDLCCWCPLDEPCHADVLLELTNG